MSFIKRFHKEKAQLVHFYNCDGVPQTDLIPLEELHDYLSEISLLLLEAEITQWAVKACPGDAFDWACGVMIYFMKSKIHKSKHPFLGIDDDTL